MPSFERMNNVLWIARHSLREHVTVPATTAKIMSRDGGGWVNDEELPARMRVITTVASFLRGKSLWP